jgi:hypothetical protein
MHGNFSLSKLRFEKSRSQSLAKRGRALKRRFSAVVFRAARLQGGQFPTCKLLTHLYQTKQALCHFLSWSAVSRGCFAQRIGSRIASLAEVKNFVSIGVGCAKISLQCRSEILDMVAQVVASCGDDAGLRMHDAQCWMGDKRPGQIHELSSSSSVDLVPII